MSKQAFIDETLNLALRRITEEVSALLGQEFGCTPHRGEFATTADYLALRSGVSALACLAISGEVQNTAHIVLPLDSAIKLGATLILLPEEEIANRRQQQVFDGEVADAFGEIANIIAGVYTSVFLEKFSRKTHFKKTSVAPLNPDPGAPPETSLIDAHFYLSRTAISLAGENLAHMEILIPCPVLGLTPPAPEQEATGQEAPAKATAKVSPAAPTGVAEKSSQAQETASVAPPSARKSPGMVLIMAEQMEEGEKVAEPLRQGGFEAKTMTMQGSIREATEGRTVAGAFVLLREVGERQLAALIKAQSTLGAKVPLVVGGAQWTRNAVLQAVKYGARDILITPAEPDEILAKARAHMPK